MPVVESIPDGLPGAGQPVTLDASAAPAAVSDSQVTQRLGRFALLRRLGTGGMGSVFAAYDEQLDRKVALKLLHQVELAQGDKRQRVLREAQAMARVSHSNVVHVYDVGEADGRIFIAMEYIDGGTLTSWQQQAPRTWQQTLDMYRQAGEGLLAAHQTGLVHRDFKPDNVLIAHDNRARVADFGLACLSGGARSDVRPAAGGSGEPGGSGTPLTLAGAISGTPGYMSPEQYRGETVDSRSDQFSFCAALYEALFQRLPFAGTSIAEQAANVLAGRLLPPPAASPVPPTVCSTLLRGLLVEPADRFPSLAELLTALTVEADPDPSAGQSVARRMSTVLFGCCALLVGIILSKYWRGVITVPSLVRFAAMTTALCWGCAVGYRRSLRAHAFHRRLVNLMLIMVSTWLSVRCLALPLHLEVAQLIPIDMMILGGFSAAIAYHYLPRLWWLVACMIVGSIASALYPQNAQPFFLMIYSVWPVLTYYAWLSAGRKRTASHKAARQKTTVSGESISGRAGPV